MIKVTLEFATQAELVAFFSGAAGKDSPAPKPEPSPKPEPALKADKAKPVAPSAPAAPAAAPVSSPTPAPASDAPLSEAELNGNVEYQALRKAVMSGVKIDKEATLKVAADLGAATFKELPPSKWAAAKAAVEAISAGEVA